MGDEWPGQRLHQYAIYDRDDSMTDILQGVEIQNINALDRCGRTPVYTAVSNNSMKCLEVLLEHGADPSIAGGERVRCQTPLHQALLDGKMDAVVKLLEFGADINLIDESGLSPINLAKSIGDIQFLRVFEKENERRRQNALEVVKDIYAACEADDVAKVKDLLTSPAPTGWELANMALPDDNNKTPLALAALHGNTELMSELLMTVIVPKYNPSIIHIATEAGHVDIVRLLLQKHPEFCDMENEHHVTPLHVACQTGSLEIVQCLLEWDYPPFMYTPVYIEEDCIEYKRIVLVNRTQSDGKSALYLASEAGHEAIVEYLLTFTVKGRKVAPNHFKRSSGGSGSVNSNSSNNEPVCDASSKSDVDIRPVQVNAGDGKKGEGVVLDPEENSVAYKPVRIMPTVDLSLSSIYIAVKNKHINIVDMLAKAGANLDLKKVENGVQHSALLFLAFENSDFFMVDKLLQLNVVDYNNKVLQQAVLSKPAFIPHFLKYKASEDKHHNINKSVMKKEFAGNSVSSENLENLSSSSTQYKKIFPIHAVNARWQNLDVLSEVEESWLICLSNMYNREMENVNARIPLFAITRVDVSNNKLTMVPSSLLQLPSLCVLVAANNNISSFPSRKSFSLDCQCLEDLCIQNNQLVEIPSYIFTLPSLRNLNASKNQISSLSPNMWQTKCLVTLDLTHNALEELPNPIWAPNHDRKVSETDSELGPLEESLTSLRNTQFNNSDEGHVIIHQLKRANHWSESLQISNVNVKEDEKMQKGMKTLKLSANKLKCFPEFLSCCCPYLETLEMGKNELVAMGNMAGYPRLLKTLVLSDNRISNMADWQQQENPVLCFCSTTMQPSRTSFGSSTDLRQSMMSDCGSCGHRQHTRLLNLESLDLCNNKLTSLIVLQSLDIDITMSTSASSLTIKGNKEQDIQVMLLFPNLTSLNVDNNQLPCLPSHIGQLKNLRMFSLKKNTKLKELPPELGLLDKLQRMEVELCPIEGPIRDVINSASNKASNITGFLRSILEESEQYNCMNLMILGASNIGKTTLLKELFKKAVTSGKSTHFNQRQGDQSGVSTTVGGKQLSTVGIDISTMVLQGKGPNKLRQVYLRTWDFAGQKEYYATHQYFLSPRSLFLVVWNMTQGEPGVEELKQWLVNIQAETPGAPVIIVGTHLDKIMSNKKLYTKDWEIQMDKKIRDRYMHKMDSSTAGIPKVLDIVNVSAGTSPKNIDKLRDTMYELVFKLNHPARKNERLLGHKVPKKYMKLQRCLENIVKDRKDKGKEPVLDSNNYLLTVMGEMTKDDESVNFRNKDDLYQATRFLHENGVLCHFEDTALKDQYFLDPQWLCDKLAKVVSIQEVQKYSKHGVMKIRDLTRLYNNSDTVGRYILSLLNKFEVALQFDADHLLLPSLLPTHGDLVAEDMREIPVKRHGVEVNMSQSVDSISSINSFGLSMLNNPPPTNMTAEMFITSPIGQTNPAFSYTRLYLLTYFPSGFWPRLISRILADESFYEPVIKMFPFPQEISEKCPGIQKAVPKWRCWQTGLELVYFETVVLQVKEIQQTASRYGRGMCDYWKRGLHLEHHFEDQWAKLDVDDSALLEISFPADNILFNFCFQESWENQNLQSRESKMINHDEKAVACILAKVVEHTDSLLQDWFPEIGESRFMQNCMGRYLITRIIPCPLCLQAEIEVEAVNDAGAWEVVEGKHSDQAQAQPRSISFNESKAEDIVDEDAERVMCAFLVENCIRNVLEGVDEICKIHGSVSPKYMPTEDNACRKLFVAPDVVFQDLDERFVVDDDSLHLTKKLGTGAFGTVSAAKLRRGEHTTFDVAVKVLYDPKDKTRRQQAAQMSLETLCMAYSTARQEVSILQTVEHPHIVPLLGLSRRPLALLLSLAPLGSLTNILESRYKDGLRLPVWVIKLVVIQTAEALNYLHHRSIIYRDLKSDNVLIWNFPGPTETDPRKPVHLKLADYGISRPVMPAGAKGFGGTPPFIAPEILLHCGKDTYTEKVDIFSFGMFMFELLTCRLPLAEINNPTVHVSHGGRPSITNEEALYPSHMLDLMTVCWSTEPQHRPSAEQVCMIASSPQFCHLSDAVTMETESAVFSACSVFAEDANPVEQTQVWIASEIGNNHNVEILAYNTNNKCIAYKELQQDNKVLSVCNVNKNVWCLDSEGSVHVYSCRNFEKVTEFALPVTSPILLVYTMMYHPGDGGHVIILLVMMQTNSSTIFCVPGDIQDKTPTILPIKISRNCFNAAVVKTGQRYKLWLGSTEGEILVRDMSVLDTEERRLTAHSSPSGRQQCIFIATPLNTPTATHSAWTYNYPGSMIYHWNTDVEKVTATLDCSLWVPSIDRYKLDRAHQFEANQYQVTAVSAVDKYLYVSTTWGCIIVADATSMQALSVFRCHGKEDFHCKCILPLGPLVSHSSSHNNGNNEKNNWSDLIYSRSNSEQMTNDMKDSDSILRGVVTIGRGYVDVLSHVTRLQKQVVSGASSEEGWTLVDNRIAAAPLGLARGSERVHTFVLSWTSKHWEYY